MNEEPRSSWVANTACSLGLLVEEQWNIKF